MPLPQKPIVVVGSVNIDLVARTHHIPAAGETVTGTHLQEHPGGKGANQAVAIARFGWPVHLLARVGDDAFSHRLRDSLTEAGVDLSALRTSEGPTGVALIVVSDAGENSIVVVPGANALLSPQDIDDHLALIRSAAMVLTQLETPLETVLHLAQVCRREGVPLMLDPAPACELPRALLEATTWFTPNETEAAFFVKSASPVGPSAITRALRQLGLQNVVLKLGERGAWLETADAVSAPIPSLRVDAVDTTAAGDCFNGVFAANLCLGKDPVASAKYASAAAAIAVSRVGAQPSMPTAAEVQAMLERDGGSPFQLPVDL